MKIDNLNANKVPEALRHVRYEMECLLLDITYNKNNNALHEAVTFSRLAHCRVLYTFFTAPKRHCKDDVLAGDFDFEVSHGIYGDNRVDLLNVFNKRLLHLSYNRIEETVEWPVDELIRPVQDECLRFIDHIISGGVKEVSLTEMELWQKLKHDYAQDVPLLHNSSNVNVHQTNAISSAP